MTGPILATEFTPWASGLGGMMIGAAGALLLAFNGRIAGISGIMGGLLGGAPAGDRRWRLAFVAGLLLGGLFLGLVLPTAFETDPPLSWPALVVGGLIVGFGTRLGSGCTSGHGVCGLSRFSGRSLAATATFMVTGFITVYVVRHLAG
ncbi:MAG: YeeE/YedE family protein [Myxococcota bacterium]